MRIQILLSLLSITIFAISCKKDSPKLPKTFGNAVDIDGNNYLYTEIRGDDWMIQNLTTARFQNGDTIPEAKTEQEWEDAIWNQKPAWCHFDNDSLKGIKYGKLYNFYAVRDLRNLAPVGWHISTESEWYNLAYNYNGEWAAGEYLKSETGWANDGNGNNESYFNALSGGSIRSVLYFYGEKTSCWFWTSTHKSSFKNQSALLPSINNLLNITPSDYNDGLYIRCVKNN